MHHTPATPAGKPGTLSTYRLDLAEQRALSIRLHCAASPLNNAPQILAQPCRPDQATRFVSHEAAAVAHAHYLPHTPVEIVRVDA